MLRRFLATALAVFVLPLAGGAVIEQEIPGELDVPVLGPETARAKLPASAPDRQPDQGGGKVATPQGPGAEPSVQAPAAAGADAEPEAVAVNVEQPEAELLEPGVPATVPKVESASPCPDGMVLVSGEYCTEVRHTCKRWLDDRNLPFARCGEYEREAQCVGSRVPMHFCIDQYEYTPEGESLPVNFQSFVKSSKTCKEQGKRICTEAEWNFACEGEEMRPYPYGWERQAVCNQDREDLYESNPRRRVLRDLRAKAGEHDQCVSPFGVHDMVGNLDEHVLRESQRFAHPFRNAMKGGWWMAGRNRCRPATTAHDDYYSDIQVGTRCCADLPGAQAGAEG